MLNSRKVTSYNDSLVLSFRRFIFFEDDIFERNSTIGGNSDEKWDMLMKSKLVNTQVHIYMYNAHSIRIKLKHALSAKYMHDVLYICT